MSYTHNQQDVRGNPIQEGVYTLKENAVSPRQELMKEPQTPIDHLLNQRMFLLKEIAECVEDDGDPSHLQEEVSKIDDLLKTTGLGMA